MAQIACGNLKGRKIIEGNSKRMLFCQQKDTDQCGVEKSKLELRREKYAKLTNEERHQHTANVKEARNRRVPPKQKTNWLLKALMQPHDHEGDTIFEPICSPLHELEEMTCCHHCGAMKFQYEPPTFCCDNGKVKLAYVAIPTELHELYTSQSVEAVEFRKNIRAYNNIFSFTSFGVKLDKDLASSKQGIYTFRVLGQIYHSLPSLHADGDNPCWFQLYFIDVNNEVQNRMSKIDDGNLNEDTVKKLMRIMEQNPYAKQLRRLKDYISLDDIALHITKSVNLDQRVYNSPTSDQVAAIWIEGNNPNVPIERDIIVHSHSGQRHRIKHYFGCYDPLQYPLLFPNGESGWHQNIKKVEMNKRKHPGNPTTTGEEQHSTTQNGQMDLIHETSSTIENVISQEQRNVTREDAKKVSCREYSCYKLQIRNSGRQSHLIYAGRLLQQYAVDMYIKLETTRLDFIRRNQSNLRAELYQGLVDSVAKGETRGSEVGRRIVLPASFIGGPRDMRRRYLDAMALVRRLGKPDLFITMTCNPEWKEIQELLLPGQSPQDRPDLTTRVFRSKLQDIKDQLFTKEIFGKVAAHVHVVEFQKRGLPHAHILIILKSDYKILTPDQFDRFVCAELPDKEKHPQLYDFVVKHMMHGPCGDKNKSNPCMVNGKCKSHYPRPFCSKTIQGKDGYPIYKRTDDGKTVKVRNTQLNNQWVVPYNPYLLTRYNCHINVEICSGLTAIKYLYKYIYKGHDRVTVCTTGAEEENVIDEIQQFQDARWVSAQEAMWRIFEFNLSEMYPAVINLPVHLPNKQSITYCNNQNLENVLGVHHLSKTMLTEFFHMCSINEKARGYLYGEFPEHFVWNKQRRCWYERQQREVIGRLSGSNPMEGERYYLRLLLNHVRGPTSFEYLLTVNGVTCSSFKEAAQKRGLLESDDSLLECLNEAVSFQMPHALRRLFATILIYCEPTDVRKLWDTYYEALSEDFKRENGNSIESQISKTLRSIQSILESMGKSIHSFDLPNIPIDLTDLDASPPREISDELSIEIPTDDYDAQSQLNADQQKAFDTIIEHVKSGKGAIFFVDGPGGTGKTFLYRALLAYLRSRNMIAIATATSGVAASIMPGGRTAHSRFKIPIELHETSQCSVSKQSGLAELCRQAKLIIWDEAPMAKRLAIETVHRSLQDFTGIKEPFGGKVVVLGGDFRQVVPVVPRSTIQQTIEASLVRSFLYQSMKRLTLSKNMRARSDPTFSEFLLRVGNGTELEDSNGNIQIPEEMLIKYDIDDDEGSEQRLIDAIFPSLRQNANSASYMTSRAILACKNEYVDKLNNRMIEVFPGHPKTFNSFDEAIDDNESYYEPEFLNSLTPNGMPPHKLVLKKNCPIMLLRNLDPADGLCNGTRMVCKNFENNVIHAEIAVGQYTGKQVFIPRIPLSPAENEGYPFVFKRKQFPVRLCFAMTINKSQGQTIPHVGVYLPKPVFSHGQLYVALSRGTSMSTTKVLIKPDNAEDTGNTRTRNIVYKQVLSAD